MRINEIARPKHNILTESCQGLTSEQRRIVEGIYNEFKPILEVALTPQQINQLFTATQQAATDAGGNRTLIGRGVDAASAVNRAIDNVGKWLQNTAPVQAFDQKFETLKGNIAQKFPQLGNAVSKMGEWAKANPGKTAAIVGVLTTIAALGAGPAGGAIAGQILRGTAELLKGEKLSTAIGKGVKTAALGYLSGKAIEKVGEFFANVRAEQIPYGPAEAGLQTVKLAGLEASGPGEYFRFPRSNFILADGFDARRLQYAFDAVKDSPTGRNIDELIQLAKLYSSESYTQQLANMVKNARQVAIANDQAYQNILNLTKAAAASAQGAAAAADNKPRESRSMTGQQINEMFQRVEEGVWDWVKGKAAQAGQAIAGKVAQVGQNITTKVTADKLASAWKAAGSPNDSDAIHAWLIKQGIKPEIVNKTFQDLKIPVPIQRSASSKIPGSMPPTAAQRQAAVQKSPQQPTTSAGMSANKFGSMVKNLTGQSATSSTGGTTQKTATGMRHTANPNNPNLAGA